MAKARFDGGALDASVSADTRTAGTVAAGLEIAHTLRVSPDMLDMPIASPATVAAGAPEGAPRVERIEAIEAMEAIETLASIAPTAASVVFPPIDSPIFSDEEVRLVCIARYLNRLDRLPATRLGGEIERLADDLLALALTLTLTTATEDQDDQNDQSGAEAVEAIVDYEAMQTFASFVRDLRNGAPVAEISRDLELTASEGETFRRAWEEIRAIERAATARAVRSPRLPIKFTADITAGMELAATTNQKGGMA